MRQPFDDILTFTAGYWYDRPELAEPGTYLAFGSQNIVYTAPGKWKPFRGLAVEAGKIGSPLMFLAHGDYWGLGNKASVATAKGSVAPFISNSIIYSGAGELYRNGVRFTAGSGPSNVDASVTPKIVLKQSGVFTSASCGPFELGLDVPRLPAVTTVTSGNNTRMSAATSPSNYSVQITAGRSLTGHESNPTAITVPIAVTNLQALAITFGAADSNGTDRFHVYGSKSGEGGTGQPLKVREIKEAELSGSATPTVSHTNGSPVVTLTVGTVDRDDIGKRIQVANFDGIGGTFTSWIRAVPVAPGSTTATTLTMADNITATGAGKTATIDAQVGGVARTLAFEWYDGDLLSDIPPTDHNRPPACVFLAVLGDRILYIGCYADGTTAVTAANPGVMVAASKLNYPEAVPADFNHLWALPGPPTAVIAREADGAIFVFGADYLASFRKGDTSDADGAQSIQYTVHWNNVGVSSQRNVVLADSAVYCYTGAQGIARFVSGGDVDRTFAAPIADRFIAQASSAVIVGFDPAMQQIFLGTQGGNMVPYSLAAGVWGAELSTAGISTWPVGATVSTFFTYSNKLYACMDTGGADYAIYQFNKEGVGGSTWKVFSGWRDGGHPGKVKTILHVKPVTSFDHWAESLQSLVVNVYRNLTGSVAATKTYSFSGEAAPQLTAWKSNVKNCRSYKIELTSAADADAGGFNEILIDGTVSWITV
jgi:hypothetical protein